MHVEIVYNIKQATNIFAQQSNKSSFKKLVEPVT